MKRFLFLSIIWGFAISSFAQFYDKEDDIYFYVQIDGDVPKYCCVFNFDGEKATYFNHTYQHSIEMVKRRLKDNPNYFENKVYDANYDVIYTDKYPSVSYIYSSVSPYNSAFISKFLFTFSSDREKMTWKALQGSKVERYKRVPKSYFISGRIRSRSNENNVIYE